MSLTSGQGTRSGASSSMSRAKSDAVARHEEVVLKGFGTLRAHDSMVLKSYPLGMALPPLPSAPPVPAGQGFLERLDALRREGIGDKAALQPIWTSLAGNSYKPPPEPNPEDLVPDRNYKRTCKFTYTFMEPGGTFRMYSDTALGALAKRAERQAKADQLKADKARERREKMEAMIREKEEKLRRRRELRNSRYRETAEQEASAARIQSIYRGRRARQRVEAYKEKRNQYAAARIQYSWRLYLDRADARAELDRRREMKRRHVAATRIQTTARNKKARSEARSEVETRRQRRERERAEEQARIDSESAAKIQALYRGRKGREEARDAGRRKRRDVVARKQEKRLQERVRGELDRAGGGPSSARGGGGAKPEGMGAPFGLAGGAEAAALSPTPPARGAPRPGGRR